MQFIHTLHYMLHYCMIVYSPFYFQFFFLGVYKLYTQLCALHLIGILYFTGILHTGTCCSDIRHFNKYTPGIYCILLEFQHIYHWINIMWMVLVCHYCMIVPWCLPLLLHLYSVHHVHIACVAIVSLISRIRNVYIWYIHRYIIWGQP